MTSSLSNLVDNLAKGIHKIKFQDCNCFFNTKVAMTFNKIEVFLEVFKCGGYYRIKLLTCKESL